MAQKQGASTTWLVSNCADTRGAAARFEYARRMVEGRVRQSFSENYETLDFTKTGFLSSSLSGPLNRSYTMLIRIGCDFFSLGKMGSFYNFLKNFRVFRPR